MGMSISEILEKCNIYLDDSLISKEQLLARYMSFLAETMSREKAPVGFALHTGNICFDALSIAAAGLGCLSQIVSTIDDLLAALHEDDYVIYEGQRYRWKGIREESDGILRFVLEQDGVGKHGLSKRLIPCHENKYKIKPYYGTAQATNAVGVKPISELREHFLAYVLDCPVSEVPPEIDVAVVIVCARDVFSSIYRRIYIEYGDGQRISLAELLPASYYTDTDCPYQIGENPTKAEPVLKVTGNLSVARELVYDRSRNEAVGFLSLLETPSSMDIEDLSDILRAPPLRYAFITAPVYSKNLSRMIEQDTDAAVFACTKRYLAQNLGHIQRSNQYTKASFQQAAALRENRIVPLPVPDGISEATHSEIRRLLSIVRSADWEASEKDTFIGTAYSLLNLFTTAVFTMEEMETAITAGRVSITSPHTRIQALWDIADQIDTDQNVQEKCAEIADKLERLYQMLCLFSPKREELRACLERCCPGHLRTHLAIIVPKAYYAEILAHLHRNIFARNYITCVTPARFAPSAAYEYVISVGELKDKRYQPSACLSARIYPLLAPCERRFFSYRQRNDDQYERLLNARMGIAMDDAAEDMSDAFSDEELHYFTESVSDLADFKVAALRGYTANPTSDGSTAVTEATHIGRFTTGEQILFSRYYTAVVFDPMHEEVTEKKVNALAPGDTLVFTKRNSTTQNIVDMIYAELLYAGRLGEDAASTLAKSLYWKTVLRAYRERKELSCSALAKCFEDCGTPLREASIRQWLSTEAHIIGPQKISSLESIASISKDPFLLNDVHGYFDACARMRSTRRKILDHIAVAIHAQLSGSPLVPDPTINIVADHVEKLSETLTLEDIMPLDETFHAKSSLVNHPITEAEVSL